MANKFNFQLITPDGVTFNEEVDLVTMPTENGEMGVMANHLPLVTILIPGPLEIRQGSSLKLLSTGGGFAEITAKEVKVYAQTAEFADSIDEKRAIEARERALELTQEQVDEMKFTDAKALLERNIARLKTIERKKKRSHRYN